MGAGRQRLEPANQQVYRSIPATNVANQECVEGEAILSARPFKNVNLLAFFYGCWPPAVWTCEPAGLTKHSSNERCETGMRRGRSNPVGPTIYKRQLGVLPMCLEDLLPKSSPHTPTSTAISLKPDDVWLLRLLRFLRVFCNLGI